MRQDFFKVGSNIKLANHPLQALIVGGSLLWANKYCMDVKSLPGQFAPLLQTGVWSATKFHLTMRLWTDGSSKDSNDNCYEQALASYRILRTLKPIFTKLVTKQLEATYSVILEVARHQKLTLYTK